MSNIVYMNKWKAQKKINDSTSKVNRLLGLLYTSREEYRYGDRVTWGSLSNTYTGYVIEDLGTSCKVKLDNDIWIGNIYKYKLTRL